MIDWRYHVVTYSEVDENGFIGIQFDAFGEEQSGMPTVEVLHPFGLMANPPEPDVTGAFSCSALIGWEGDQAYAQLCSDPRSRVVLPFLKKGETIVYGASGNFVRMHADGRISLFTTDDNTPNGKTVALQVMPDGLLFSAPWGKLTFDATGFHVVHVSGAAIDLGAIGGLPGPLSALSSYVKLTGNMASTEASVVSHGTAGGAAEPAAKALTLLGVLGSIDASLIAIQAALVAIGAGPGGVPPAVGTAVTAAGLAVTAAGIAIAGAAATLPSASTAVT